MERGVEEKDVQKNVERKELKIQNETKKKQNAERIRLFYRYFIKFFLPN